MAYLLFWFPNQLKGPDFLFFNLDKLPLHACECPGCLYIHMYMWSPVGTFGLNVGTYDNLWLLVGTCRFLRVLLVTCGYLYICLMGLHGYLWLHVFTLQYFLVLLSFCESCTCDTFCHNLPFLSCFFLAHWQLSTLNKSLLVSE